MLSKCCEGVAAGVSMIHSNSFTRDLVTNEFLSAELINRCGMASFKAKIEL